MTGTGDHGTVKKWNGTSFASLSNGATNCAYSLAVGPTSGPNDLMDALLGQVEDLSQAAERLALDAGAAPTLPDPQDRAIALLP